MPPCRLSMPSCAHLGSPGACDVKIDGPGWISPHALIASCLAVTQSAMAAQPATDLFPSKPIRLIVPQPPSGTVDMLARMIGGKLTAALDQQVVIDNRAGASGTIGSDLVAKAPADGHTILMTMTSHTTTPSLYPKLPYDAIKDFVPVSMVVQCANLRLATFSTPLPNTSNELC